jgi:flagellar assembly protein FliH
VQQALEKGRAEGLEEGRLQGLEQGARQSREAMEQEVATQCEVLAQAAQGLSDLLQDPQQLFAPLKRLALHMAQHIAKHELRTSPTAIDALVQNCLNALDHPIKGAVIVELNPQDKKLLEALVTTRLEGVHLEAVPQLQSGSVRVIANDMVVEDLIENRMEALARGLALVQPTSQRSLTATPSREPVTVLADKVEEENKPVETPSTDPDVNQEAGDVHP